MDFQTIRLYGSIAVILGCFIFLYPKLLHPLIMAAVGRGGNAEKKAEDNFIPPPLREQHPHLANAGRDVHDHAKSFRHGPHPGMRAAAAEQSRQSSKGSGRGMMGVILPMYAIGIVVYLAYTLFKVFNKKDDKSKRSPSRSPERNPVVELAQDDSFDEGSVSASVDKPLSQEQLTHHLHELHKLADKVQENDMNVDMRKLQQRLAETESQMSQILAAMQAVQTKVGKAETATGKEPASTSAQAGEKDQAESKVDTSGEKTGNKESHAADADDVKLAGDNTSNNQGEETGGEDTSAEVCNASEGSSHESESYEIISPSEQGSNQGDVETINSMTGESRDQKEQKEEQAEEVEEVILKDKEDDQDEDGHTSVRKRAARADQ